MFRTILGTGIIQGHIPEYEVLNLYILNFNLTKNAGMKEYYALDGRFTKGGTQNTDTVDTDSGLSGRNEIVRYGVDIRNP